MIFERRLHLAMIKILALRIDHYNVPKDDINLGMLLKKSGDILQSARQILLITIQIGEKVARGPAQAPINGIVHSLIFFHENFGASILWQPIQRAIVRPRILHDMFRWHLLVRDRRQTKLKPRGTSETGCDDGKLHSLSSLC